MNNTDEFLTEFVECEECGGKKTMTYKWDKKRRLHILDSEECRDCPYVWKRPKPDSKLKQAITEFADRFLKRIRGSNN